MNTMLPFMESIFIEVTFNQKQYMIGLIYRVPNTNIDNFIDTLNNLIEPIKNKYELILMGDFNIDLLQDNNFSRKLQNMTQSNYLVPSMLLKPWVSDLLVKRIKMKDKLAKLHSKGRIDKEIFTRFRNLLTTQLRNAKSKYFQSEFTKNKGNIKKTWQIINSNIRKSLRTRTINLKEN